jgi:hypothetical protein
MADEGASWRGDRRTFLQRTAALGIATSASGLVSIDRAYAQASPSRREVSGAVLSAVQTFDARLDKADIEATLDELEQRYARGDRFYRSNVDFIDRRFREVMGSDFARRPKDQRAREIRSTRDSESARPGPSTPEREPQEIVDLMVNYACNPALRPYIQRRPAIEPAR